MNYSAVSEYDNVSKVPNCSSSLLYQVIDNILTVVDNTTSKFFCPLCVDVYEFKFSLMEHLRSCHNNFLLQTSGNSVEFEQCPFCCAKFYSRHLTTKHALLNHSKVIAELYVDRAEKNCIFCQQKIKKKSPFKFTCHIEEHHFLEFEKAFQQQFLSADSRTSLAEVSGYSTHEKTPCIYIANVNTVQRTTRDFLESSKMNCFDFTELKEQLENVKEKNTSEQKSILKSHTGNICMPSLSQKHPVRRVLRFDLPDSDNTNDKENSIPLQNSSLLADNSLLCCGSEINQSSETWLDRPKHCSTPKDGKKKYKIIDSRKKLLLGSFKSYIKNNDDENHCGFQCGRCSLLFHKNTDLVKHVKKNHHRFTLNLLQPCFQCAICNARFFKNNYLQRHNKLHISHLRKSH